MQKIPKITKDLKARIQEAQNVKQKKKTIYDPDFEENLVVLKWTMQTEKKHVNGCLYGAGFSISPCGGITDSFNNWHNINLWNKNNTGKVED